MDQNQNPHALTECDTERDRGDILDQCDDLENCPGTVYKCTKGKEKLKLDPFPTLFTKSHSTWFKDLNMKRKLFKIFRRDYILVSNFKVMRIFFEHLIQKEFSVKETLDACNYINFRTCGQ